MSDRDKEFKPITVRLHRERDRKLLDEIGKEGKRKQAPRLLELARKGLQAERRSRRRQSPAESAPSQMQRPRHAADANRGPKPSPAEEGQDVRSARRPGIPKTGGMFQESQADAAIDIRSNPALAAMLGNLES